MAAEKMSNKLLRILIADQHKEQRIRLERVLNKLGYFRIAPVSSFRELVTLTHYSCEPFENFDLLLLGGELAFAEGVDPGTFCLGNPQIRHALIYGARAEYALPATLCATALQQTRWVHSATPDNLYSFMCLIDPLLAQEPEQTSMGFA